MHDRALPPAVVVRDVLKDETLHDVHRGVQAPALPPNAVALDREARAVGLGDVDWTQIRPQGPDRRHVVVPVLGRDRDDAGVEHLDHLAGSGIDEEDQILDRMGVAVVSGGFAQRGRHPDESPAEVHAVDRQRAAGPGVVLHLRRGRGRPAGPARRARRRSWQRCPRGRGPPPTAGRAARPERPPTIRSWGRSSPRRTRGRRRSRGRTRRRTPSGRSCRRNGALGRLPSAARGA